MFFFKKKYPAKRLAKDFLLLAKKIEDYRGDVLTADQWSALLRAKRLIGEAADLPMPSATEKFTEVEKIFADIGGDIYPMTGLVENVEVFLFAAILALAIRTFFFQPFEIPTNSMYPTYAGMQYEFTKSTQNWGERLKRWALYGASHYQVNAPAAGDIFVPVALHRDQMGPYGGNLCYRVVDAPILGIVPSKKREYTFRVGDQPVTFQVPLEFNIDDVVLEAFFPGKHSWIEVLEQRSHHRLHRYNEHGKRVFYLNTGIEKKEGEPVLNFDILSGDMLFVNKFCYHFTRPKVGDPFVFRTRNIEGLHGEDKYFIKRLAGIPSDQLEVRPPELWRNGKPIEGAEAFAFDNQQRNGYPGYTNVGLLSEDQSVYVDNHCFFAMGDNSPESSDSRYWGFVPEKEVVGKAVFILYPFTKRWGISH
ncbi:MAG: signal peptidase I [Verrucomicrobiota bacterium]|nr:MAG: signal peptidase I [Verrucomicrobiota bacterium]